MDIIIVNDYAYVQGGAAQVAVLSARGLADEGYQITFVFAVGPADHSLIHPNIRLVDFSQYDLLSNPNRISAAMFGLWNVNVTKKMTTLLSEYSPENTIIHIHSWVKALTSSVVRASINCEFSHVITLHDYFTACPNGGFYNFKTEKICHIDAMSSACISENCDVRSYPQKLWRVLRQAITTRSGIPGEIKNFIYVSEFSKSILNKYLPTSAKFWNIRNPIDVKKVNCSNPDKADFFTFVGRLSVEKGVAIFARAAQQTDVRCRFVGAGDLIDDLKKILPNAEYTGWANRSEVSNYIANSRAIVFPSQLYETQGMVVAEAAALGIPCIVSDACAGRDFVSNGTTGLWFKAGDVVSLTNKINLLKEEPNLAVLLGRAAYEDFWRNAPTLKRHVSDLLNCYTKILDDR